MCSDRKKASHDDSMVCFHHFVELTCDRMALEHCTFFALMFTFFVKAIQSRQKREMAAMANGILQDADDQGPSSW